MVLRLFLRATLVSRALSAGQPAPTEQLSLLLLPSNLPWLLRYAMPGTVVDFDDNNAITKRRLRLNEVWVSTKCYWCVCVKNAVVLFSLFVILKLCFFRHWTISSFKPYFMLFAIDVCFPSTRSAWIHLLWMLIQAKTIVTMRTTATVYLMD